MISTLFRKQSLRALFSFESKKAIISILLGLAGFIGAFFPISFSNPPFTLTITWWYFLPFLAGLAYGGRYGFMAGLLGLGGIFPFFLWPTNGWANVVVSALLIGWYTWQGYAAEVRRARPAFWNHPLVISLPYMLVYSITMRWLYPLAFSFNPPFWNPQAELTMPIPVLEGIIIKGILLIFMCLTFSVFILKTPPAQYLFDQVVRAESRYNSWIFAGSLSVSLSAWGVFVLFNRIFVDHTLLFEFFQRIEPHETIALVVCLAVGFFVGVLITQALETFLAAEDEFNRRKDEFILLAENSTDMISRHDPQGVYLYVSPACRVLLGYEPEDMVGHSAFEFIHPDDLQLVDQSRRSIIEQPIVSTTVFRLRKKNGDYIWLETISRTILDPDTRKVIEIHASTRDITERRKAEELVRLSEARYRQAIIAAGAVPYYRDYTAETQTYTFIGEGILQLTGYPADEITPAIFDALEEESVMRDPQAHLTAAEVARLNDAGEVRHWACDYRMRTRDGQTRWLSDSAVQVRAENGQRIGVIGILQDITDRKRAEEELRASEARWRTVVEAEPECVKVLDGQGKIVEMNPAGLAMLEATPAEVRGKPADTLVAAADRQNFAEMVQAVFRGETRRLVFDMIGLKGRQLTLETISVPLWNSADRQQVDLLVGITRDITERKKTDEALRASERKYRLLFENMTSGFAVHQMLYDAQGDPYDYRYLEVNPAFEKLTGFPVAGMIGKTIRELMPDTEEYWIRLFGKVARTGEPMFYMNYSRVLGKYYDTYVFSPEQDKFAVVFNDVTERVEAEMALRRERDRAQNYLDTVEAILLALDVEGRILLINRMGGRLLGYQESELIGLSWFETCLPQPDGLEVIYPTFKRMITGELGVMEYYENSIVTRAGELRHIAWHNTILRDEQGRITGALSAGEDITERKRAELKLQEQLAELRRWHQVTLGREERILELKREVNALLVQGGQIPRYPSADLE